MIINIRMKLSNIETPAYALVDEDLPRERLMSTCGRGISFGFIVSPGGP